MLAPDTIFLFGPFRLVPAERALYGSGGAVRLHGRAFDLLLALVERAGEVIAKDELLARVWPQTFVEEGNLRVHVAALRKVLQDDSGHPYVDNVVGRGYSFVAPVRRVAAAPETTAASALIPANVPLLQQPRLFGRRDTVQRIEDMLSEGRLVTVAGPGGMGKTSVALSVAARSAALGERVHMLDMAPLADAAQLGGALAMVLGVPALAQDPVPGLLAHLRGMQALLVFDNCEHVIDAAAALAERLLHETNGIRILATSREPLRAEGECVHRLPPLALPECVEDSGDAFAALAASPAVQLFAERAASGMDGFKLTMDNAACVADICRRLDGIPLAIELAAGRAEFFGVQGLAARLEDCFAVLTRGRRTALPRHQTLRATLDWSYDMLPPLEQAILRRFAVFRAPFGLDCAIDVVCCGQVDRDFVVDSIANLAAKSLLSVDSSGSETQYRLLGTTRAYALDKLRASGELERVSGRYVQRCCTLMEQAQNLFDDMPLAKWLDRFGGSIGHVRAALDWALDAANETAGDALDDDGGNRFAAGLRLCAASATLWYQLSLMDEYRRRLEQAMRRVEGGALRIDAGTEMRLQLAMGHALVHVGGQADSARRAEAFARALALAERLDDGVARMAALWGCYTDAIFGGDYQAALGFAERYGAAAVHGGELAQVGHARMLARSMHYLGHQQRARAHVDFVARHPLSHRRHALHRGFQFDQHISTLAIQGRVLWLQGYPEQAAQVAQQCVDDALRVGHGISLCFALLLGCTVAAWSGHDADAARYTEMMLDHSQRCSLPHWHFWGEGFALAQRLQQDGDDAADPAVLALQQSPYCGDMQVDVMATLHLRLLSARAIARADAGQAGWSCAEVLRSWGESMMRGGSPEQAGQLFQRALDVAREQGAGAWELRAATSLARLRQSQGRAREALAPLQAAYGRFTEGFGTRDLLLARALLDELA
ncbi:winged helix-turn-helix domain-containing protein [Pseudoduganella ginsengisoli]|uniref:Transcriptional regulator n=1 Tax=Pseudoduganella ginsengisoli TaxID=1462440 RepID=A0A6L6PXQ2_9BURK|nr:winged helix-turn-helix domain-containing protein [Pseudoduganella ginsengisoli]MTW02383.1 transcriptional regulator [Pseudoduganella ginsengisoli]